MRGSICFVSLFCGSYVAFRHILLFDVCLFMRSDSALDSLGFIMKIPCCLRETHQMPFSFCSLSLTGILVDAITQNHPRRDINTDADLLSSPGSRVANAFVTQTMKNGKSEKIEFHLPRGAAFI
jgi:hypothetical protein